MKKITQNLRWLVTLLTMIVSVGAWAQEVTIASFSPSENEGWDITNADYATAGGGYYKLISSDASIVSPSCSWSNYTDITITITARKFGGPDATQGKISVSQGTTELASYSPAGTSLVASSALSINPSEGAITISCPGASNSKGCGVQSIVITGTPSSGTPTPTITVDPATVNATAEETDGTLAISYDNLDISSTASFGIQYYNANNEVIEEPDWIVTEVESEEAGVSYMISYVIDANEGEARTAYCKVYAMGDEDFIYSNLITINQAEYVAPSIATLPFVFDGGRADIENTEGLTQEGLDSDYGSSPKLKFNSTGDWVLIQFDEVPGDLSFDIKGNSFSGSTFTVQTSSDGKTYTDLKNYTVSNLGTSTQTETFDNLSSDVRYIKWIYTEKVSGNVALGNIKLEGPSTEPSITVNPATVDATAEETEGTLAISYKNLNITDMTDFGIQFYDANNEETTEPDWVEVLVAEAEGGENYLVSYYMINNEGDARTAYCKVYAMDDETNLVYSDLITIKQAAAPSDIVYTKVTSTDDITDGQYLIVYEEGSVAFNGGLTTLDASGNTIGVVLNNGTIEGSEETEAAEFTINVTEGSLMSASGKYIGVSSWGNGIKPSDTSDYKNSFAIEEGNAIISIEFSSGNMILNYNSDSNQKRFRYYKNGGQQPIQLYKKVVEEETSPTVTIGASKWATYVAEDNVTFPTEVSAFTVETIKTDHVTLGEVLAVKKGTPILVYSETPGTYTLEVVAEDDCEETFNNQLKVSDGTMTGGATIYVLAQPQNSEIGFYPLASNVTIPAGKAYLEIPPTMSVKGFLALGGLADAINNITAKTANGTIFNIAGQKVQNITKGGLYIVNGKKVFVK